MPCCGGFWVLYSPTGTRRSPPWESCILDRALNPRTPLFLSFSLSLSFRLSFSSTLLANTASASRPPGSLAPSSLPGLALLGPLSSSPPHSLPQRPYKTTEILIFFYEFSDDTPTRIIFSVVVDGSRRPNEGCEEKSLTQYSLYEYIYSLAVEGLIFILTINFNA